jgi:lipopolysaccharide/colanic/teichoic acid biosynthesis glycosyltransferase
MKTGTEYALSEDKDGFNSTFAHILAPLAFASRAVLEHSLEGQPGEDLKLDFDQERLGANGEIFLIHKLRTLDDETGEPLNRTAELFRRNGIDELAQVRNLLDGEMNIIAHRPLPLDLQEMVFHYARPSWVRIWLEVVAPEKPGMASSFSLANHREALDPRRPETVKSRADDLLRSDIRDHLKGSLTRDTFMIGRVMAAMVKGEM